MFDLSQLLISAAYAQEAAPSGAEDTQAALMSYVPFILIFAVFYFLVIRPQQKRLSDQDKMLRALKTGDRVVASGGIHGKIAKIEETFFMVEIADGVQIKIDRDSVTALETKPDEAKKETSKKEGGKKE